MQNQRTNPPPPPLCGPRLLLSGSQSLPVLQPRWVKTRIECMRFRAQPAPAFLGPALHLATSPKVQWPRPKHNGHNAFPHMALVRGDCLHQGCATGGYTLAAVQLQPGSTTQSTCTAAYKHCQSGQKTEASGPKAGASGPSYAPWALPTVLHKP